MNSYKKLCAEFYDIDKPQAPAEALAFYLRYAQQAKGPILEPMCGSGRFLLPLLEHGFPIDGMDGCLTRNGKNSIFGFMKRKKFVLYWNPPASRPSNALKPMGVVCQRIPTIPLFSNV